MVGPEKDSGGALEELRREVALLKKRVSDLEQRHPGGSRYGPDEVQKESAKKQPDKYGTWSEGSVANIMSRGAVVSLVLLVALVLRHLADSRIVDPASGTLLGIGYAVLLGAVGFWMYSRRHSFAPVFSIAGILLLVAVIFESHTKLGTVPALQAYALMAFAAGGMTVLGRKYRVGLPVCIGITVVLIAGVPLDFPEPNFAALSVFLAAVNLMAFTAGSLHRCRWLRPTVFTFTAVILSLWAVKLSSLIKTGAPSHVEKWWFFAVALYFFAFYTGASILAVWKGSGGKRDVFINILPTSAGCLSYLTSLMVVNTMETGQRLLGLTGAALASFLLCVAALRAMEARTPPMGINTFAFPAAFLLALSFRDVSGESVVALAILSWAAFGLVWLSSRWSSDGVRVTSYFLQAMVLGASSLMLLRIPSGGQPAAVTLSMIFIGIVAFTHYLFVRRTRPPGHTAFFSQYDRKDLSGIIPLIVSAGAFFLTLRSVVFVALGGGRQIFQAAETSIISLVALFLFVAAWVMRNTEFKWVAAFITILGGGKVFFYDLFKIKGIPVLLSFLAFALAASMGSFILKRWPQNDAP